ncbi:hypothetical protein CDAR_56221 [Caerostris darwini]|uniref:Uncharacterized protein n=1 Tax=Caerostris darwini TaxID=1538125 RepID=A0AAV4RRX6_9ARAC|nr:hypothetical protein CDAR_56221 [Caerostris darwini]
MDVLKAACLVSVPQTDGSHLPAVTLWHPEGLIYNTGSVIYLTLLQLHELMEEDWKLTGENAQVFKVIFYAIQTCKGSQDGPSLQGSKYTGVLSAANVSKMVNNSEIPSSTLMFSMTDT